VDSKIDCLLQRKQERIDQVMRGKRKTIRERSIRSLAAEILESIKSGDDTRLLQLAGEEEEDEEIVADPAIQSAESAVTARTIGRPRKGIGIRKGMEISLDERTIYLLNTQVTNKSAFVERAVLKELDAIAPEVAQMQSSKLHDRLERLPDPVARKLKEIEDAYGTAAAYEASEAVILFFDPSHSLFP
jgi:hypothetical protein